MMNLITLSVRGGWNQKDEMEKDKKNLTSLIVGIILSIIGLFWTAITIHIDYKFLIVSAIILLLGAFFSLYGGLGKWK